jgi:hypothetical protein
MPRKTSSIIPAMAAAVSLAFAAAPAAGQVSQPAAKLPAEPTVVVAKDAPPGSSASVAVGAAIGLVAGLLLLTVIVGSSN